MRPSPERRMNGARRVSNCIRKTMRRLAAPQKSSGYRMTMNQWFQ